MKNNVVTKISKKNWEKLKHHGDGSIDNNLNKLMNQVESTMPFEEYNEETKSISIYKTTAEKLDTFRISMNESRDNILTRMFLELDRLNNSHEVEIPFRLTSPLNKELVIEGLYTGDGFVYDKIDSFEFKAWVNLLDWKQIESYILGHSDERISFHKPNYWLDVNYG